MARKTSKPAAVKKEQTQSDTVVKASEQKAAAAVSDAAVSCAEVKSEPDVQTSVKAACKKITKENAILQFSGLEVCIADVIEKAKSLWKEEHAGQEPDSISVYIKPEENRVYYVANDTDNGDFEM